MLPKPQAFSNTCYRGGVCLMIAHETSMISVEFKIYPAPFKQQLFRLTRVRLKILTPCNSILSRERGNETKKKEILLFELFEGSFILPCLPNCYYMFTLKMIVATYTQYYLKSQIYVQAMMMPKRGRQDSIFTSLRSYFTFG